MVKTSRADGWEQSDREKKEKLNMMGEVIPRIVLLRKVVGSVSEHRATWKRGGKKGYGSTPWSNAPGGGYMNWRSGRWRDELGGGGREKKSWGYRPSMYDANVVKKEERFSTVRDGSRVSEGAGNSLIVYNVATRCDYRQKLLL